MGVSVKHCRIAVGIPTIGRAAVLRSMLADLMRQTRTPDSVIVCGSNSEDVEGIAGICGNLLVVQSAAGLPRQRNTILDAARESDIVVFFDDDFLPQAEYLATIERHMQEDARIVVATGHVIADGISGTGYSIADGHARLAADTGGADILKPTFSGYGCNMAIRMMPVRIHNIRFDERLPLYGWQEDVDFSRRLAPYGSVTYVEAARGVHLGIKVGRTSGRRLGYSQVSNPIYLWQKRSGYPFARALTHIACNVAMNALRAPLPEVNIDRRGRLHGNMRAFRDLLVGTMAPERALEL